jgi:hypothetical protein
MLIQSDMLITCHFSFQNQTCELTVTAAGPAGAVPGASVTAKAIASMGSSGKLDKMLSSMRG